MCEPEPRRCQARRGCRARHGRAAAGRARARAGWAVGEPEPHATAARPRPSLGRRMRDGRRLRLGQLLYAHALHRAPAPCPLRREHRAARHLLVSRRELHPAAARPSAAQRHLRAAGVRGRPRRGQVRGRRWWRRRGRAHGRARRRGAELRLHRSCAGVHVPVVRARAMQDEPRLLGLAHAAPASDRTAQSAAQAGLSAVRRWRGRAALRARGALRSGAGVQLLRRAWALRVMLIPRRHCPLSDRRGGYQEDQKTPASAFARALTRSITPTPVATFISYLVFLLYLLPPISS
jgi:hypothetical protein